MTAQEYREETFRILMGDKKYPKAGYKPIEIRERIEKLLEREKRTKIICAKKEFLKTDFACPYCGWHHN